MACLHTLYARCFVYLLLLLRRLKALYTKNRTSAPLPRLHSRAHHQPPSNEARPKPKRKNSLSPSLLHSVLHLLPPTMPAPPFSIFWALSLSIWVHFSPSNVVAIFVRLVATDLLSLSLRLPHSKLLLHLSSLAILLDVRVRVREYLGRTSSSSRVSAASSIVHRVVDVGTGDVSEPPGPEYTSTPPLVDYWLRGATIEARGVYPKNLFTVFFPFFVIFFVR